MIKSFYIHHFNCPVSKITRNIKFYGKTTFQFENNLYNPKQNIINQFMLDNFIQKRSFTRNPANKQTLSDARIFDEPRDRFPRDNFQPRPRRDFDGDLRPRRDDDFQSGPRKDFDRPRRDFDNGPRRDFDNGPRRDFDRPRRDDDRPRRDFDQPRRDFDDRPRRNFDDRPIRREFDDRLRRRPVHDDDGGSDFSERSINRYSKPKEEEEERDDNKSYKTWHASNKSEDLNKSEETEGGFGKMKSLYDSQSYEEDAYNRYKQEDMIGQSLDLRPPTTTSKFGLYQKNDTVQINEQKEEPQQKEGGFFKSVFDQEPENESIYNRIDLKKTAKPEDSEKNLTPKGSIGDFFEKKVVSDVEVKPKSSKDSQKSTVNIFEKESINTLSGESFKTGSFADRLRLSKITTKLSENIEKRDEKVSNMGEENMEFMSHNKLELESFDHNFEEEFDENPKKKISEEDEELNDEEYYKKKQKRLAKDEIYENDPPRKLSQDDDHPPLRRLSRDDEQGPPRSLGRSDDYPPLRRFGRDDGYSPPPLGRFGRDDGYSPPPPRRFGRDDGYSSSPPPPPRRFGRDDGYSPPPPPPPRRFGRDDGYPSPRNRYEDDFDRKPSFKMSGTISRDLNRDAARAEFDEKERERERTVLGERDFLTWNKYPSQRKELKERYTNPMSKKSLYKHPWPELYERLHGVQDKVIQHFEKLRTDKKYRWEQKMIMVQGEAKILDLVKKGYPVKSLVVTAPYKPKTRYEIQPPALDYIERPPAILAEKYYLMNIDMVRKILGSAARPEKHELVAEFQFPIVEFPSKEKLDRILVLENVNDHHELGMLLRSARALGWQAAYLMNKSGDVYNDFVQRASDFYSLTIPYIYGSPEQLPEFLEENEMEMMFAMKIPHGICTDPQFINTPDRKIIRKVKNFEDKNLIDTPFNFWHTRDKEIGFPKRVALCVSDAYESGTFPNHLRAGLNVTSLNVPSIGSLLMWEINRIMNTIQNNNNTTTATTTATATATTT